MELKIQRTSIEEAESLLDIQKGHFMMIGLNMKIP